MPKFYNESEHTGARIYETPNLVGGGSGFDALGRPVPMHRRNAAYSHAKAMGCSSGEVTLGVIDRMAECIARDQPHLAMEHGLSLVDVTGVYRLMAALMCD